MSICESCEVREKLRVEQATRVAALERDLSDLRAELTAEREKSALYYSGWDAQTACSARHAEAEAKLRAELLPMRVRLGEAERLVRRFAAADDSDAELEIINALTALFAHDAETPRGSADLLCDGDCHTLHSAGLKCRHSQRGEYAKMKAAEPKAAPPTCDTTQASPPRENHRQVRQTPAGGADCRLCDCHEGGDRTPDPELCCAACRPLNPAPAPAKPACPACGRAINQDAMITGCRVVTAFGEKRVRCAMDGMTYRNPAAPVPKPVVPR